MKSEKISHPSCINFLKMKFRKNNPEADMTTSQSNQNEKKKNTKKNPKTDVLYCGRFHVNEPYALYKQRMEGGKKKDHLKAKS